MLNGGWIFKHSWLKKEEGSDPCNGIYYSLLCFSAPMTDWVKLWEHHVGKIHISTHDKCIDSLLVRVMIS